MLSVNWEFEFSFCNSIDEKIELLNNILFQLFELYVPPFKGAYKRNVFPKNLKRQRRSLRRLHFKLKCHSNSQSKFVYSAALTKYKKEIKSYLLRSEQKVLDSKSTRKFWSFVRSKTTEKNYISALNIGGQNVVNDFHKAERFNEYFCSVFTEDNGKAPRSIGKMSTKIETIEFDVLDVFEVLTHLDCKSSKGPDGIPQLVYQKLSTSLSLPLYIIHIS